MIFMTCKQFEKVVAERVAERIEKWQEREDREREFRNMYTHFYKLEERVIRLERKAEIDSAAVEVKNAEKF